MPRSKRTNSKPLLYPTLVVGQVTPSTKQRLDLMTTGRFCFRAESSVTNMQKSNPSQPHEVARGSDPQSKAIITKTNTSFTHAKVKRNEFETLALSHTGGGASHASCFRAESSVSDMQKSNPLQRHTGIRSAEQAIRKNNLQRHEDALCPTC